MEACTIPAFFEESFHNFSSIAILFSKRRGHSNFHSTPPLIRIGLPFRVCVFLFLGILVLLLARLLTLCKCTFWFLGIMLLLAWLLTLCKCTFWFLGIVLVLDLLDQLDLEQTFLYYGTTYELESSLPIAKTWYIDTIEEDDG